MLQRNLEYGEQMVLHIIGRIKREGAGRWSSGRSIQLLREVLVVRMRALDEDSDSLLPYMKLSKVGKLLGWETVIKRLVSAS